MSAALLLVRHGRTAWNREVRFRGRLDLPLDDLGQAQAQAAAEVVRARWPDAAAIYSSPLQRALQTGEPIGAALGLPVQPHQGLVDIHYGDWTGHSPAEIEQREPERYRLWRTAPQDVVFPDGEGLAQVRERLLGLLEEMARNHDGQTVVLVGHLVVNRVLFCTLLGVGLEAFWRVACENAAIGLADYGEGKGRIRFWNDTCHLSDELRGGSDV